MANTVLLKKSSVAAKVPLTTDLAYGEVALNYTDGKLYFKNSSNVIQSFVSDLSSYVTLTGTQTLTNKTLTSPVISGGIIDNAVIGGTTPAAITGSSVTSTGNLVSSYSSGDEGGEILLTKPQTNTSIGGVGVRIDVYQNKLRIWEDGGTNRGVYVDLTAASTSVGTNLISAAGGGTVTSITAGTGLTGGTISTSGTIAIDSTVATLTDTQLFQNKSHDNSNSYTTKSSLFTLQDSADVTKQATFDLSNIATGNTHAFKFPNVGGGVLAVSNNDNNFSATNTFSGANNNFGASTGAGTTNLASGSTISGATKTVNIGTGGLSGSTTSITIGSTLGNSNTTLYGTVNLPLSSFGSSFTLIGANDGSSNNFVQIGSGTLNGYTTIMIGGTEGENNFGTITNISGQVNFTDPNSIIQFFGGGAFSNALSTTSSLTASGSLQLTGSNTSNQNIATNQTTGTLTIGGAGTTATGSITLGRSTGTQIVNIATGIVTTSNTKTINIGTSATTPAGTTSVNIGANALTTTTIRGPAVTLAALGTPTTNGTSFNSPALLLQCSKYLGGVGYNNAGFRMQAQYNNSNNTETLLFDTPELTLDKTTVIRYEFKNTQMQVLNTNDAMGFEFMATYSTAYLGIINTGGAAGVLPANGYRNFFAMQRSDGAVGSVTPNTGGSPEYRNKLDDGSGNLIVGGAVATINSSRYLQIAHTTASTSTTTGALRVAGGAGIVGNLNVGGDVVFTGNLTVNGTTTTVNSTTVTVDDKNIELGSVASPSNATADGGGITLKGTTDKTFNWVNSTIAWTSSEHIDLASGKSYYIGTTAVLSGTALGSSVLSSSLTSVGTVTSGTWSSEFGAVSGANLTNLTAGNLTGTIPSAVLGNSTVYIGSTAVALNRATGSLALTGISSIDGSAATLTTARTINGVSFDGSANITIPSNTTNALTIGTGLSGTSFDGSSAVTIAIDSTVATLTGSQTLTNKTINLANNTLTATSAQIAAAVTDETGSGSLVFATSPTLVTPNIGDAVATKVTLNNGTSNLAVMDVVQATVATVTATAIDSFAIASFRSAKYTVQITQGSNYQVTEILVLHNGTTTFNTQYGQVETNGQLATFTTDISAGNARLLVTMGSATSATINIQATMMAV